MDNPATAIDTSILGLHKLPDDQAKVIRGAYDQACKLKIKLADIEIRYQHERADLIDQISGVENAYKGMLRQAADTIGLPKDGGTWDFDMHTLSFIRRHI